MGSIHKELPVQGGKGKTTRITGKDRPLVSRGGLNSGELRHEAGKLPYVPGAELLRPEENQAFPLMLPEDMDQTELSAPTQGQAATTPADDVEPKVTAEESAEVSDDAPATTVPPPQNAPEAQAKPQPETTAKPDGKGLQSKVSIDRFVAAAKLVEKDWAKLTKVTRGDQLGAAAGAELKAAGVPPTGVVIKDLGTTLQGQLDFTPWNIDLNEKLLDKSAITQSEMSKVADVVYHESRHAEQWHLMARLEAGKGKSASKIASNLGIKKSVAQDAKTKPLKGNDADAADAKVFYDSVYGAKSDHRDKVYAKMDAAKAATLKLKGKHDKLKTRLDKEQNAVTNQDAVIVKKKTALDAALAAQGKLAADASKPTKKAAQQKVDSARQAYEKAAKKKKKLETVVAATKKQMNELKTKFDAKKAEYQKWWQAYRDLPEEVDARKAGEAVATEYDVMEIEPLEIDTAKPAP